VAKPLHSWNVTPKEAVRIQRRLQARLWFGDAPRELERVGGVDVSYVQGQALAAVVILEFPGLRLIEAVHAAVPVNFPYVPGLLSFREGPPVLKAWKQLQHVPDVVFFDGHGMAHPRGFGLASHLGLWLHKPTVGCAKSRLVGSHDRVPEEPGGFSLLIHRDKVIGAVLRNRARTRPIFISPGHRLCLAACLDLTRRCSQGYRLPEPTRLAHREVTTLRRRPPHRISSV